MLQIKFYSGGYGSRFSEGPFLLTNCLLGVEEVLVKRGDFETDTLPLGWSSTTTSAAYFFETLSYKKQPDTLAAFSRIMRTSRHCTDMNIISTKLNLNLCTT